MLDCDVLMLYVSYKRYSCYKTREKGCMAMIVCERVRGNIIAFLLVSARGAQLSLTVCLFWTGQSSQVTFMYIALLTIQIVSKQLHNIKIGKCFS